ncbi:MAG: hypothetical protein AB1668_05705 [Nanoarchaeota archaeon]
MPKRQLNRKIIIVAVVLGLILMLIGLSLALFLSKMVSSFSLFELTIDVNGLGNFLFYLGIVYVLIAFFLGVLKWVQKRV